MVLDPVVVDGDSTVVEVARQRYPSLEAVVQGFDDGRSNRCLAMLSDQPGAQRAGDEERRFERTRMRSPAVSSRNSRSTSYKLPM